MSKTDKMKARLLSEPKDYTFEELESLLKKLGFMLNNQGKTSGSAVKFIDNKSQNTINLHKPHPSPVLKRYLIKYIISELKKGGYLSDR
ncbi:MAG: type II toxin-antitoxin system HicA family toxin [Oscillospiraceae bacterium]|nr:type II toxin-antitoxin system HicA family toxin [Oscillospiraceae bacterium]